MKYALLMSLLGLLFINIACSTLGSTAKSKAPLPRATASIANVQVTKQTPLPLEASTAEGKRWQLVHGEYNGYAMHDYASQFLAEGGRLQSDFCTINAQTPKQSRQPILEKGEYTAQLRENIFERNGEFSLKTYYFKLGQFEVTCFLGKAESGLPDVQNILRPLIIFNP